LTAPAVAAGAVAKQWLRERYGVVVRGYLSQLGPNRVEFKSWEDVSAEGNPFFVADRSRVAELEAYMDKLRKSGESVGARLTVVASGVPSGWGEPLYDRLDADIAKVMMGINAVKGVEIGAGFKSVEQLGTEHSDEMTPEGFLSNNAGGILGGISTGQDIVVSIAVKPTSSIRLPRRTIDIEGHAATIETHGRHDPCVGIRATPIAEAFLALVLIDHALRHRAQNGDVKGAVKAVPAQAKKGKGKSEGDKLEDPDPLEA
jgi:chorismate synthase